MGWGRAPLSGVGLHCTLNNCLHPGGQNSSCLLEQGQGLQHFEVRAQYHVVGSLAWPCLSTAFLLLDRHPAACPL